MADAKQSELVQQFCLITACPSNEANFHLESCDWNLDTAIQSFFDNTEPNNNINIQDIDSDDDRDLPSQPSADLQETFNRLNASFPPPSNPNSAPGQAALNPNLPAKMAGGKDKKKTAGSSSRGTGGVRTLADLHRRPAESDSDSDSDRPQEYYTGGEKSGMLVQDPSKKPDVDDIFEKAKQHNAPDAQPEPSNTSSSRAFTGAGRLLSGEAVQTTPQPAQVPESVAHNITFWRNGFTVDDGPLRRLDDPANAPFLESIQNSECPQELEPADRRTKVHVNLSRRPEDYPVAQPPSYVAFQGVGRTLGSSRTDPEPSSTLTAERLSQISQSSFHEFSVDNSKPSTSISIRLSDGTRMVARFNHHHTVADIRAFINASRPGAVTTYQLQSMGFPPKALDDPTQTVEQAGLINAVVIQKL